MNINDSPFKSVKKTETTVVDTKIGNLSNLQTIDKSNLVNSLIEETKRRKIFGANVIDFGASGSDQTTTGSINNSPVIVDYGFEIERYQSPKGI